MSRIDVFVPCYCYGHFLRDSVQSILRQSHSDLRVLIIDDASRDETPKVAARLAEEDPRVTVLTHAGNRGHIATYNEGLEWAESDYILLLSADDMLAPGALRRAAAVMDTNSEVVLTYGACIELVSDDVPPTIIDNPRSDCPWEVVSGADYIAEVCQRATNLIHTPTAIGRTEVQKRIGGYRPELPHSGDAEMWLRFAAHGHVARTRAVQAFKREHSLNMSTAYYDSVLPDYEQRRMMLKSFFSEYGHSMSGMGLTYDQARRGLAEFVYLDSIRKLLEGRPLLAHDLYRYALHLWPDMRLRPPVGRLLRTPRKLEKIAGALNHLAANLAMSARGR